MILSDKKLRILSTSKNTKNTFGWAKDKFVWVDFIVLTIILMKKFVQCCKFLQFYFYFLVLWIFVENKSFKGLPFTSNQKIFVKRRFWTLERVQQNYLIVEIKGKKRPNL